MKKVNCRFPVMLFLLGMIFTGCSDSINTMLEEYNGNFTVETTEYKAPCPGDEQRSVRTGGGKFRPVAGADPEGGGSARGFSCAFPDLRKNIYLPDPQQPSRKRTPAEYTLACSGSAGYSCNAGSAFVSSRDP